MKKLITFVTAMLTALASSAALSWTEDFDPQKLIIREDSKPKDNVAPRRAADDNKMLEKGKTWWYCIEKAGGGIIFEKQDYAITVGDEVDIDGETWNELYSYQRSYLKDSDWKYSTDTIFVAYMRENDGKLYTQYDIDRTLQSTTDNCGPQGWLNYICHFDRNFLHSKQLIVDFDTPSGETFRYGTENDFIDIRVGEWGRISNSNHTYNLLKFTDNYGVGDDGYIKNIGPSDNINHFFEYVNIGVAGTVRYYPPQLRYVTDASGEIIYEGFGGRKLWEDFAGVEDVAAEANTAEVKWYNLQGIQVAKPEVPGIYIRRQGNDSRKIAIR